MNYDEIAEKENPFPYMIMERSEYSPNQCFFRNDEHGVWLYQTNCIEFMDILIGKYPEGRFDMVFVNPPYFLSNGVITCHMVQ